MITPSSNPGRGASDGKSACTGAGTLAPRGGVELWRKKTSTMISAYSLDVSAVTQSFARKRGWFHTFPPCALTMSMEVVMPKQMRPSGAARAGGFRVRGLGL